MDNNRINVYEEMIGLCQQYLIDMKDQDSWNEVYFQQFEKKWDDFKRLIALVPTEPRSEEEREQEFIHCQSLFVLYQSIIDKMERHVNQLASQVQGVRQSKTIMNAYYGVGRSDRVAYYFDEKK